MSKALFLRRRDLREAAGHRMICGFKGKNVDAELKEMLREIRPLGVILFSRNIESPEHAAELIRELKSLPDRRDDPLLVSVDHEGGRVARLPLPATQWPAMASLGELDDRELSRSVGHAMGSELRALGFDINYAPVLDVNTNPANPVIGNRAFSTNAEQVGRHATAYLLGLRDAGVGGCGKHFPGHGDTAVDSHLELPAVENELPELREREWRPYREAIGAGLDAVMTAHLVAAALDERMPATLSRQALAPLRNELHFPGVILSDDIEMKAVAAHFLIDEIASKGLEAGIDVFLACKDYGVSMACYRGIVHAFENGVLSHQSIQEAHQRSLSWRARWCRGPEAPQWDQVGAHRALAESIEHRLNRNHVGLRS